MAEPDAGQTRAVSAGTVADRRGLLREIRLARREALSEEDELPASRDQAGEALRRCIHAEPELPRVGDEPAGQGEEREAQPLRAGRAQVGR